MVDKVFCGLMVAAAVAIVALWFGGCSGELEPSPEQLPTVADVAPLPPESQPTVRTRPEVWSFDPIGKRDPYRPYTSIVIDDIRELTALQQWELDQLRLVGILRENGDRVAMLEDPRGQGHIATVGDYVGKRRGQITGIRRGEMEVTEYIADDYGRRLPITYSVGLPEPWPEG